jgi:uncharacterized membrane protein HdeD (DUF308 family)
VFLLFGKSMNPVVRLLIGVAAIIVGIVVHLVLIAAAGGVFVVIGAYMIARRIRQHTR